MRIKSYFAATMMAAMAQAREELGEDAVLVSSRRAPIELRHLGEYEVVFGKLPVAAAEETAEETLAAPAGSDLTDALIRLERQIGEVRALVEREPAVEPPTSRPAPRVQETSAGTRLLESAGLVPALAESLGRRLDARQSLLGPDRAMADLLANHVRFESALYPGRAVVLVGPAGCGRTTLLVKLAVQEGLAKRRPVRLISTDLDRVAAGEPLRSYARLLGVDYQAAALEELAGILDSSSAGELVLVDTPGLFRDAGRNRFRLPDDNRLDVHLVLPAPMQPEDMEAQATAAREYQPRTLVFTRFDETAFPGAALSCAIRSELPISFVSSGGEIPADLAPASPELFAKRILKRRRTQAISAA